MRCRATPVILSLVKALQSVTASQDKQLANLHTLELSSRGALVRYLQRTAVKVTLCEYFDNVPSGEIKNGILCQDVQRLGMWKLSISRVWMR